MKRENDIQNPDETDFHQFGKKTTYQTPADFFETISEITLELAKKRKRSIHRKRIIWITTSVAASLLALLSIGVLFQNLGTMPDNELIAQDSQQIVIKKNQVVDKLPATKSSYKISLAKPTANKKVETAEKELVNDVLIDLTDDELLQMAAWYKTDPFTSEAIQ